MKLRLLGLLGVALLVAGCIGFTGDPTAVPPTPAPTAIAGASPQPTVPPTQPPPTPFACPALPGAVTASLDLRTATGVVSIPLEPGVTVPMPSASIAPIDPANVAIEGTVLGGTELRGDLVLEEFQGDPAIVITALTARFVPLDASPSAPVVPALDGASIVLTLPDKDAVGRLLLQLDWNTSCGPGEGGGAAALTVQNSTIAAGCPTTADAMLAAVRDAADLHITIGGVPEPLDVYGWSARWTIGNGVDDYGTLFPNWDRSVVITVAPEAFVAVREKVDDLHLVSVRASIYNRADVDAYFAPNSSQEIDPVTVIRRDVNPSGNVNIPAPLDPGTYVFDIDATWLTSCFELNTTRSVSVKVVAPA